MNELIACNEWMNELTADLTIYKIHIIRMNSKNKSENWLIEG